MQHLFKSPIYVAAYLVFMFPAYVLPFMGSNSALVHALQGGMGGPFWAHLFVCASLVAIAHFRGNLIDKPWLPIFPFLALVFDLVPAFNWIPLVPTICHLLAIILGTISAPRDIPSQKPAMEMPRDRLA